MEVLKLAKLQVKNDTGLPEREVTLFPRIPLCVCVCVCVRARARAPILTEIKSKP